MLSVAKKQHTRIGDSQSQRSRKSPVVRFQRWCFVVNPEILRLLARFWPNRYGKDVAFTPHQPRYHRGNFFFLEPLARFFTGFAYQFPQTLSFWHWVRNKSPATETNSYTRRYSDEH